MSDFGLEFGCLRGHKGHQCKGMVVPLLPRAFFAVVKRQIFWIIVFGCFIKLPSFPKERQLCLLDHRWKVRQKYFLRRKLDSQGRIRLSTLKHQYGKKKRNTLLKSS